MFSLAEPLNRTYRLIWCMKKLILLGAVLLGAATATQAGVRLSFGFGIPLGAPAPVVVSPPPVVYQVPPPVYYTAPAPVYTAPAPVYTAPPAVVYAPPPVVYAPPPTVYFRFGTGWRGYYGWGHHGWHRW
jgi:hypothetical protein